MIMFQLIIMSIKNDQHYRSAPLEPYNRGSQHWRAVSFCWKFHQVKSLFREYMWKVMTTIQICTFSKAVKTNLKSQASPKSEMRTCPAIGNINFFTKSTLRMKLWDSGFRNTRKSRAQGCKYLGSGWYSPCSSSNMLAGFRSRYTICRLDRCWVIKLSLSVMMMIVMMMMMMMMMMMARVLSWPVHVFKAKYDLGRIELHLVLVENPMLRQVVVKVTWLMIIEDNWS